MTHAPGPDGSITGPTDLPTDLRTTTRESFSGLFAAVTTPVTDSGALDLATFDRHLELLIEAGVDGVCLGGATAEYPHSELHDRRVLIARAARRLPDDLALLTAIGAPNVRHVIDLGKYAFDQGSQAVLVPMPMFFRYQQQDLAEYCREVAQALAAPCLIYDLPEFTNPIDPGTVIDLLEQEEHIVGIKDSSGRPDRQSRFAEARGDADWALLVGDDARLKDALTAGWDGGVSGIACLCPELMVAAVKAGKAGDAEELARLQGLIDDLIAQISGLPVPWGLRIGLEARGLPTGPLAWPMSAGRREHAARLQAWLPSWLQRVGAADWTRVPSAS
jgi:4-hydroxy-tetrahydrodipicolinate synthase